MNKAVLKTWIGLTLLATTSLIAMAESAGPDRLYSKTDPSNLGGIKGRITSPSQPIEQILAIPPDEPRLVYRGNITGNKKNSFEFSGLPMRKYDLIVIYKKQFFEGLQLHRSKSTLTQEDLKKIDHTVQKSEPYFKVKELHRLQGTTGRGNAARGIYTFVRSAGSDLMLTTNDEGGFTREEWRRTFKLVMLKEVGVGWQIERTRDLYPVWIEPKAAMPKHSYRPKLSNIRVTDYQKDLGSLDLL